jgi:hypothetical protein
MLALNIPKNIKRGKNFGRMGKTDAESSEFA